MEPNIWWHKKEWWIDRIKEIVSEHESESSVLDFKSGVTLRPIDNQFPKDILYFEIAKDVSAMANGSGGTIIYGIEEEKDKDASTAKSVCPVTEGCITPNQIETVAIRNIYPYPNIKIHQIFIKDYDSEMKVNNDKDQIIVVEVQRASTCYMVQKSFGNEGQIRRHDKKTYVSMRYYQRVGTETVVMNGSMVEDVMRREEHPKIELNVAWRKSGIVTHGHDEYYYRLHVELVNTGVVIANKWKISIHIPIMYYKKVDRNIYNEVEESKGYKFQYNDPKNGRIKSKSKQEFEEIFLSYYSTDPCADVLFPDDKWDNLKSTTSLKVSFPALMENWGAELEITLFADNMEPIQHQLEFREISIEK